MLKYHIRPATRDDAKTVLELVIKLAAYEKLSDQVRATAHDIVKCGFSERPYFEALLAVDSDDNPLGLALYFFTFSTFLARPSLYLEDLFVSPEYRGQGIGKAFFREMIKIAQKRECGRIEWSVLDWNESSIKFYKSLGARPVEGWTMYRLESVQNLSI